MKEPAVNGDYERPGDKTAWEPGAVIIYSNIRVVYKLINITDVDVHEMEELEWGKGWPNTDRR